MKATKWTIIILNLVVLLAFLNYSAMQNEKIFKEGKLIFLELIGNNAKYPLIQGDVMSLKYKIGEGLFFDTLYKHGYVVVQLDSNAVAQRIRFQQNNLPKTDSEYIIAYRKERFSLSVGAEQYFLQQGQTKKYEQAKYSALCVDATGKSLLMGLYDSQFKKIE